GSRSPTRSSSMGAKLSRPSPWRLATSPTSTCCRCKASTSTTFSAARAWCSPRLPWRRWRRASNEQEEEGCARYHPVRHHHREVDDALGVQPGDVQGGARCLQAGDQGRGGAAVQCEGKGDQYPRAQGQEENVQEYSSAAERHQARDRDPRRGSFHRCDDRAVTGGGGGS